MLDMYKQIALNFIKNLNNKEFMEYLEIFNNFIADEKKRRGL